MMNAFTLQSNRIVRAVGNRWQRWQNASFYKRLPVGEVFSTIYQSQAWGTRQDRPFCSGDGSIREDAVGPYCDMVRGFIESNEIERVVDLGCGDFGVGSRIIRANVAYTGIDVVPALIDYNQKMFGSPGVEFRCLNIIDDDLPPGDLCLVRQVLQHLSNAQIQKILKSLSRYRYVIVTEHVYSGAGVHRNLDKPQGPGTRVPKRSGVFLESPPFGCAAKVMLEVPLAENDLLRSVLVSHPRPTKQDKSNRMSQECL
jgi:SAM-dependent methyltransferase